MRHGFLLIYKTKGPTSHDVVAAVRTRLSERQVGHLGTLDPQADGLLVCAVGSKALKVVELFNHLDKEYEVVIRLGATSSTYDTEGVIEETKPKPGWEHPLNQDILRIITNHFLGKISQIPPDSSAVSVGGERAYRKFRQGRAVVLPSRTVSIERCDIVEYSYPLLTLRIACSAGTYIRSIAHELGLHLRWGGYVETLRRTKVGNWSLDDAGGADNATWAQVAPLKDVMKGLGGLNLEENEAKDISHGRDIEREIEKETLAWFEGYPIAILTPKDGERGLAHPRKVL